MADYMQLHATSACEHLFGSQANLVLVSLSHDVHAKTRGSRGVSGGFLIADCVLSGMTEPAIHNAK